MHYGLSVNPWKIIDFYKTNKHLVKIIQARLYSSLDDDSTMTCLLICFLNIEKLNRDIGICTYAASLSEFYIIYS